MFPGLLLRNLAQVAMSIAVAYVLGSLGGLRLAIEVSGAQKLGTGLLLRRRVSVTIARSPKHLL